jgi:hypothetical protein
MFTSIFLNPLLKEPTKIVEQQRRHQNPLFGHIGDEMSKQNRKAKYTGHETPVQH